MSQNNRPKLQSYSQERLDEWDRSRALSDAELIIHGARIKAGRLVITAQQHRDLEAKKTEQDDNHFAPEVLQKMFARRLVQLLDNPEVKYGTWNKSLEPYYRPIDLDRDSIIFRLNLVGTEIPSSLRRRTIRMTSDGSLMRFDTTSSVLHRNNTTGLKTGIDCVIDEGDESDLQSIEDGLSKFSGNEWRELTDQDTVDLLSVLEDMQPDGTSPLTIDSYVPNDPLNNGLTRSVTLAKWDTTPVPLRPDYQRVFI